MLLFWWGDKLFTNKHKFKIFIQKGIYQHITGHLIGKLSIRIIGWGITEDGFKYWICSNSWGDTWGEKGFFRIIKGENECGIEEQAVTGIPKI